MAVASPRDVASMEVTAPDVGTVTIGMSLVDLKALLDSNEAGSVSGTGKPAVTVSIAGTIYDLELINGFRPGFNYLSYDARGNERADVYIGWEADRVHILQLTAEPARGASGASGGGGGSERPRDVASMEVTAPDVGTITIGMSLVDLKALLDSNEAGSVQGTGKPSVTFSIAGTIYDLELINGFHPGFNYLSYLSRDDRRIGVYIGWEADRVHILQLTVERA